MGAGVFLAGASGLIGLRPVPRLVCVGHEVVRLTRTPSSVERLRFVTEWLDSETA